MDMFGLRQSSEYLSKCLIFNVHCLHVFKVFFSASLREPSRVGILLQAGLCLFHTRQLSWLLRLSRAGGTLEGII